jgi:ABC-type sugar transport system ATPase subunit
MSEITFTHVTKRFGETVAVNDLCLTIADGELLVLVGPSGCGKTTALRMLAGLETISHGEIRIGRRVVNEVTPGDRDIAMVFQSYALYPHMTVRKNLAFGLRQHRVDSFEIERRVGEAAAALDLRSLLDRKPSQLSGGQRQRVALGRAIVREPAAFLMDEPLSNLDAALRVQTRAEILKLQRRLRTTTVYVTHDQVEAMTMGDRIAVMQGGLLQQIGSPHELFNRPRNTFVATFLGSPAMNLLPADTARAAGAGSVGFRPDDAEVVLSEGTTEHQFVLRGTVEVVEYLGNEQLAHVQVARRSVVVRVGASQRIQAGDAITFAVANRRLHFFDANGNRQNGPASPANDRRAKRAAARQ